MRGAFAMPDAECPRCNATQPPPESVLATCARCGLVFTPHELQHKRPISIDEPPPELPGVQVRIGDVIEVRWSLDRVVALLPAFVMGIAWMAIALAPVTWGAYVIAALPTAVIAYVIVNSLVSDHVVTISPRAITYRVAPWPRLLRRRRAFERSEIDSVQMIRTRNTIAGHHYRFVVRGAGGTRLLCTAEPIAAISLGALVARFVPLSRID